MLVPISLKQANEFVKRHHRHHGKVVGHKFSIGYILDDKLLGVAIVGRPVNRYLDDGFTLEVTRLCTIDDHNICSQLYASAWRASKAMGYKRIVTYILGSERGSSVRSANYRKLWKTKGGSWSCKGRPREDKHPTEPKICYGIVEEYDADHINKILDVEYIECKDTEDYF